MAASKRSHDQLHLFASSTATPREDTVQGVPVPPEVVAMAQKLPPGLFLGTSSWSFPGWAGLLYDRVASEQHLARYGLAAYAQHPLLRTVGIDRTYYAPLAAADFASYAAVVPEAFRFLVKAPALCTHVYTPYHGSQSKSRYQHNALFLDADYTVEQVVGPYLEGLGRKAGPLLFQFPPQDVQSLGGPQRFAERLHAFLQALPQGPVYATELRNAALLTPAYATVLQELGACHCYNVHPRMPGLERQQQVVALAPVCVIRWMLHPTMGYEEARAQYQPFDRMVDADPERRASIAALCVEALASARPAYVITNNKAEGSAPLSVLQLAETIAATQSAGVV
jgi:uncharacterized protein YecE (DUF72 family)